MIYSSPVFIFFTFASLFVFYSIPPRFKSLWLLFISLIWYGSWEMEWPILLFIVANVNFLGLRISERLQKKDQYFIGLVGLNVLIFLALKTSGFGFRTFISPFGSSFYIFILISLVMDKWRNTESVEQYRWADFVLLPSFFPLLMGGPIERGKKFFTELHADNKIVLDSISTGMIIFSLGFIKKEFILQPLQSFSIQRDQGTMGYIFLGFITTFLTYLEFSSYTEMGRGVAKMFGIDLSLSFRPFYFSKNPNDFWQRWNITLGTWLRDYLSFPLMLKYGRIIGQNIILLVTFILMGLWHGLTLNHLYFGLFNGLVIVAFNLTNKKIRLRFWGRLWAFILIVGNGLLGVYDKSFQDRGHLGAEPHWEMLFSNEHRILVFLLAMLLVYEWFQEKLGDEFWKDKISLVVKGLICVILVSLFFWYLDSSMLSAYPPTNIPIYFKI